jgi:hypothetical protein
VSYGDEYTHAVPPQKDTLMTQTFTFILGLLLAVGSAFAQQVNMPVAPPDSVMLLARIDDSDLKDEESLKQLMQIEYDKDSMSMAIAVGSSFVPGAGWGLVYTKKKLQGAVPFVLSAIGYGVGIAYMAGAFDTNETPICNHVRDGRVNDAECEYAEIDQDASQPDRIDKSDTDPRSTGGNQPYFRTKSEYSPQVLGRNFDGFNTGLYVLVGTYVVTTALGAVWAGSTVSKHNERLRRDIESTAGRIPVSPEMKATPLLGFTGNSGVVGFTLEF